MNNVGVAHKSTRNCAKCKQAWLLIYKTTHDEKYDEVYDVSYTTRDRKVNDVQDWKTGNNYNGDSGNTGDRAIVTCKLLSAFNVDPDLSSRVGPRLVLHTPCGAGQWITYIIIVGEESPGQCAGKIDSITGPKFSLLWCIFPQCFIQDKSDESNRPKYLNVGTVSSVWPLMVI